MSELLIEGIPVISPERAELTIQAAWVADPRPGASGSADPVGPGDPVGPVGPVDSVDPGMTIVPDLQRAEAAARDFLHALGVGLDAEHLQKTPARMARAWAEFFAPRPFELTTFPNDEGYDELVIVRDIPVRSICEHHLLPFRGRACVAYLPGERIVGLSKLARIVEHFACRPQTQERLTKQVAEWLEEHLHPRAVGVVIAAEHSCMTLRGAEAVGASTVTSALLGQLRDDPRSRQEFLSLSGMTRTEH